MEIERPYTPVTGDEVKGYVDLVVKMYRPGTFTMPDGRDVKWTDGGKMSGRSLDKKQIGDYVDINGPFGLVQYLGKGVFKCPGLGRRWAGRIVAGLSDGVQGVLQEDDYSFRGVVMRGVGRAGGS